ncbi:MAG: MMPL family transporter [Rhodospirillales bacterium]|nr:MMPL family transporter [Rhodospirillales bacterium]
MPPAAETGISRLFADAVERWVDACQRRAPVLVVAVLLVSVLAATYLATHLRIDTDTEDMLSADLAFRQNAIKLDAAFPQLDDNLLVVVEAPNADAADDAVRRMVDAMRTMPDVFENVFSPETDPFLRKHGMLYLDTDELESLSTRLAAAQPFLGTLWQQPNLAGLGEMLALFSQAGESATLAEAASVLLRMADVAEKVRDGNNSALVWSEVILGMSDKEGPARRLIQTSPNLDYGSLHPASRASDAIHDIAEKQGLTGEGYRVRLTGSAALESDELKSVEVGMGLAGIISASIVIGVLLIGLRSPGVMMSLFLTLIIGLLWTAAFAILALGSLNLISVAFAVLFVGLSVDFGIHFALRASEYSGGTMIWGEALSKGGRSVGSSLAVCAITTAIAFFSFLPTSYVGLAELGLIAGVGMFVALFCNLTVLPALLKLLVRRPPALGDRAGGKQSRGKRRGAARAIVIVGMLSAVVSGWLASGARFDFDPMNLKDPTAPSVETLFDLMEDGTIHPYSAEVLVEDEGGAEKLISELQVLSVVDRVDSVHTLVPADQDIKLATIDRMALFLGPAFYAPMGTVALSNEELLAAFKSVQAHLQQITSHPVLGEAASRLASVLGGVDAETTSSEINQALFRYLPGRLNDLAVALEAGRVDLGSLPEELSRRYVSANGQVRLDILPKEDLRNPEKLRDYVAVVQSVAPNATGAPVVIVEAGRAVLDAFGMALMISLAGVSIVLWLVLRRIGDVLLIFVPVCIAALWTLAVSAIADIPFNFANVIVLPLLFGLSVDFGVHIVMRQRGAAKDAMATTTPRAVMLSALTTLGSFGSIMLSGHPGTASMGLLLSIAISLSLIAILVLLPALMQLFIRDGEEA